MKKTISMLARSVLVCALFGCMENPGSGFHIDQEGSFPVAKNPVTHGVDPSVPEVVFLFGAETSSNQVFLASHLIGLERSARGELLVLDQVGHEVLVLNERGQLLRRFGRSGDGPGEFSTPSALIQSPDGDLWIPEGFTGRYNVFDSDGAVKAVRPRPFRGTQKRVWHGYFDSDTTFLDHIVLGGASSFARVHVEGRVMDTLPGMRYPESWTPSGPVLSRDEEWLRAARTLRSRLVWTIAEAGIWFARSDSMRVFRRSYSGDTLLVIEADHRPSVFSSAESDLLERVRGRSSDEPPYAPPTVQALHVAKDGSLLVQIAADFNDPSEEADLYSSEGRYLRTVQLPVPASARATALFEGDLFTYVGVGELDVPVVVQLRLGARE